MMHTQSISLRLMASLMVVPNLLLMSGMPITWHEQPARIIVPVIDAYIHDRHVGKQYPLSCKDTSRYCHRAHQLIYHERVWVQEIRDQQARVRVPNCQWTTNPAQGCYYWIDRRAIMLEHDLPSEQLARLPSGSESPSDCLEIVLIEPHLLPNNTYLSVGTTAQIEHTSEHGHWVWLLDGKTKLCLLEYIPHEAARLRPSATSSPRKRIKLFVDLINHIAQPVPYDQYIPYTWGGASGTYRLARTEIIERPDECFYPPYNKTASGFDCSGLVWRCAQAARLDWPWRNTGMTHTHGRTVKRGAPCRNGDLIVWPGHVIIITDIDHQLVTHAEGYAVFQGKGAVYTTHINQLLQDVCSIKELKKRIDQSISLVLVSKSQKVISHARVVRITG